MSLKWRRDSSSKIHRAGEKVLEVDFQKAEKDVYDSRV